MPRRIPLLALPLLAGAALLLPASNALAAKTTDVTIMTRNLFLGADLIPLAGADPGADFEAAAGARLAEVKAGDPKARMRLVAGEIAKAKPDLVGLQEVSIWRTGPKSSATPVTHVLVDYLGVLRHELARRHAPYRVVTKHLGFNVQAPTDQGVDVRLTLGDAVLARKGVKTAHARSGVFAHQLVIPTKALGNVNTHRSFNVLDARVRGARFRFVNAHLEAYLASTRLDQAKELVAGPLHRKGLTILAGDLNSGPTEAKPEDRPPYEAIAAAGLKPYRTATKSCCFDSILTGAGGWDHNVDWIMARPKVRLVRSYVTGRERTKKGVYPSDHGGVVSVLRIRR
jgi:endonuclease/exonuclease/phosphatase family metal-dependent hydrolase